MKWQLYLTGIIGIIGIMKLTKKSIMLGKQWLVHFFPQKLQMCFNFSGFTGVVFLGYSFRWYFSLSDALPNMETLCSFSSLFWGRVGESYRIYDFICQRWTLFSWYFKSIYHQWLPNCPNQWLFKQTSF